MEEAYRPGGILDKMPANLKTIKDPSAPALKREDIDLIVRPLPRVFAALYSDALSGS
jgi:hypothetical protein